MPSDKKSNSRTLHFSLRSLLILITILGIGPGGWIAYEQAKARRERKAVEAIEALGGEVSLPSSRPGRTGWRKLILGDDSFGNISRVSLTGPQITDISIELLANLEHVQHLYIARSSVTSAGVAKICAMKQLQSVYFGNTSFSDEDLAVLSEHRNLRKLGIYNAQITDAGLLHLHKMKQIEILVLGKMQITDAGLVALHDLTNLKTFGVGETLVTRAGLEKLQAALPNCNCGN